MKAAVIVFPGSNCDRDVQVVLRESMGSEPLMVWHGDATLADVDLIVVPGGFSYGDYLRSGAMAAQSPVMKDVVAKAKKGVPVLGICNGFQVLTELGLLPGALMRNRGLTFLCNPARLNVATTASAFTAGYAAGQQITIPVAHHDGNYFVDQPTLDRLRAEDRIAFTYGDNPNGSTGDIAGVLSENRRVLGMMPHPERAVEQAHGGTDGLALFENAIKTLVSA